MLLKDVGPQERRLGSGEGGVWVCGCVGVGVWVCRCVGVWVCACLGVWVSGYLGVWVSGCLGVALTLDLLLIRWNVMPAD